jgi:hypothetical protein
MINDLEIGGTDRDSVDPHQNLGPLRHRHRLFDQQQFIGITENPRLHPIRNGHVRGHAHIRR